MRTKREKSTTTTGHYVRNADLLPAVIEAKQAGKVTNKLIKMIQMIADRYSKKHLFVNYSYREDMVSMAVENLCKNALKFDHEKYSNPFAFYTTAIHNSFLQYLADEKKHRNIRDSLLIDAGANPSFNFLVGERDESDFEIRESDYMQFHIREVVKPGESEYAPTILSDESVEVKEENQKSKDRAPGEVVKLKADEIVFDKVRGIYVKKSVENTAKTKKLKQK